MNRRRLTALAASATLVCSGLGAAFRPAVAASSKTASGANLPVLPDELAQPPQLPPRAGWPGTGRLVGFSAADLASAAPLPVLVQLTPQPAGYAELADRRAGRPAWDVAKRQAAEASVAGQEDAILQRIATSTGLAVSSAKVDILGAVPSQRATRDRRLTYAVSAVGVTLPGTALRLLAAQAGVVAVFDDRPRPRIELDHSVPYVQA